MFIDLGSNSQISYLLLVVLSNIPNKYIKIQLSKSFFDALNFVIKCYLILKQRASNCIIIICTILCYKLFRCKLTIILSHCVILT